MAAPNTNAAAPTISAARNDTTKASSNTDRPDRRLRVTGTGMGTAIGDTGDAITAVVARGGGIGPVTGSPPTLFNSARMVSALMKRADGSRVIARSISADNCGSTSGRSTDTGGGGFSEHSYGTALDLNPVQNPYLSGALVLPEQGRPSFVTSDPRAAFDRLTPEFQQVSGGYEGYMGWWGRVQSASLAEVASDPSDLTVGYTVNYVMRTGERNTQRVRLQLERFDDQLLIAGEG